MKIPEAHRFTEVRVTRYSREIPQFCTKRRKVTRHTRFIIEDLPEAVWQSVLLYFIANEDQFLRVEHYSFTDDSERFRGRLAWKHGRNQTVRWNEIRVSGFCLTTMPEMFESIAKIIERSKGR